MTIAFAIAIGSALRWEWFRFRRRAGFWVILGLLGLAVVGLLAGAVALQRLAPDGWAIPPYGFPLLVFEALSRLGPFLAVILAALAFGSDYGWGTLRPLLARGQPRWRAALVKLLMVSLVLAVVWIAAWGLAALVGMVAGDSDSFIGDLFLASAGGWGATCVKFFSGLLAAIAYLGLGAALCTAGRSTAFGVGVGIAVVIGEAVAYPLANTIVELVTEVSVNEYTRWTLWGVTGGLMGRDDDFGPWPFLPATLAYVAGFGALTMVILDRRDLSSGSE